MARGIPERWLDELKSKLSIVDVISKYIPLNRKGKNLWACCPFHHEKTPSFSVNETENYYHCFGCGVSGDSIRFVMEYENVDFYEALKILAKQAGMELPELTEDSNYKDMKRKKDRLYALMKDAARFYHANLKTPEGAVAIDYLRNRGVSDSTIVKFGIGVSTSYKEIIAHLRGKGYSFEEMVEAGVATKYESNYSDAYAFRMIIPIIDSFGQVIAFGGRILDGNKSRAKYKNTTGTILFDKSQNLYAINLLKKKKQQEGLTSAIIVEGYMDAIALHTAGIDNVVASMGTALTSQQAKLLKRYTDKVYISYDGDFAGQKNTLRGLDILKEEGLTPYVVMMPDGRDPDEVIRDFGVEGYKKMVEEAIPLTEFKLRYLERSLDKNDLTSRNQYAGQALEILAGLDSEMEKEAYIPMIREASGFSSDSLKRQLVKTEPARETTTRNEVVRQKLNKNEDAAYYGAARGVLYGLIEGEPLPSEDLTPYFEDNTHRDVYREIKRDTEAGRKTQTGTLFSVVDDEEELSVILNQLEAGEDTRKRRQQFGDCLERLKKRFVSRRVATLREEIERETDTQKKLELCRQLNDLVLPNKNRRNNG